VDAQYDEDSEGWVEFKGGSLISSCLAEQSGLFV
jgi:hypothetical protein